MDLLEYDYLEKTTENPGTPKAEKRDRGDSNRNYNHRSDGKEEIRESRSRKVGRGGENGERKRQHDEQDRGSSRHHEKYRYGSSREDHGRRSRDADRGNRADKERDRGENSAMDRVERDKKKDRTMERNHYSERESAKERDVERSHRSSSQSVRPHGDRNGDQEVELESSSKDREARERERERERESENQPKERDNRRFKEKKEAEEPEADPERDQRTVFAYQMPLKANEKDVYGFFSKAGKVRDVRVIMDRSSRRSKGFGYVEFYDSMSVPMAIALSGQLLLGQPVMVKPSEAEKNLVQSTITSGGSGGLTGQYSPVARKLYVGNLHFNMTEDQLRQVFEPFGPVEIVQLPLDLETGQCKGFGFVQFVQLEHAKAAQSLNGKLDIAGRIIKVSAVTDYVGVQETGANAGDFDDDDGGGMMSLNARSRAMLMQKLDRTGTASSIAGSLGAPVFNGPTPNQYAPSLPMHGQPVAPASILPTMAVAPLVAESIGAPSECLLLKNMFDPNDETEPDFDLDIKEEVQEECSNFGAVKHIHVEKNSTGYVYLQFDAVASAVAAQRAMHGRWFARRSISATFMLPHEYEAKVRGGV